MRWLFPLLVVLGDFLCLNSCFLAVWGLSYESLPIWSNLDPGSRIFLTGINLLWLTVAIISGAYHRLLRISFGYQLLALFRGLILWFSGLGLFIFLVPKYSPSRTLLAAFSGLFAVCLVLFRFLSNDLRRHLRRRGIGRRRVVIFGEGSEASAIAQRVSGYEWLNYKVAALVADEPVAGSIPTISRSEDWREWMESLGISVVLLPLHDTFEFDKDFIEYCRCRKILVQRIATPKQVRVGQAHVQDLLGIPLVLREERRMRRVNEGLKRIFDILASAMLLLLFSPLFLIVALAIRLDSPGPVFYRQRRLTKDRREFDILKFRSMHENADARLASLRDKDDTSGPIFKMRQDPRITRIGTFLRRTSIDELPQLLNVLVGDLSLVGPRPPRPEEVRHYEPWHYHRLEVVQGITGLWQISGRSDIDFEEMVLLDLYYINHWSLRLDLEILIDTLPVVLLGRGAY